MVPVLPATQHSFVCAEAGAGNGIKGLWVSGEVLSLLPGGKIVMAGGAKLLGRGREGDATSCKSSNSTSGQLW